MKFEQFNLNSQKAKDGVSLKCEHILKEKFEKCCLQL